MRKSLLLILYFGLLLFAVVLPGQSLAQSFSRSSGQDALVRTDSAIVYTEPDFDAPIIGYLQAGKKVRISKRVYGDVVKFYKLRMGNQFGYIADIDVAPAGKSSSESSSKSPLEAPDEDKKGKSKDCEDEEGDCRPKPMYFRKYMGVIVGNLGFKEEISGIDSRENLLMYGIKLTGPEILIDAPLDMNIAFHYGAPNYYSKVTTGKATGYLIVADILANLPFSQGHNTNVYFGMGPLLMYSDFQATLGTSPLNLRELSIGGSFSGGVGFAIKEFAIRLEAKYLLEKRSHTLIQIGAQKQF